MPDGGFGWSALKWAWANKAEVLAQLVRVRSWFRSDPGRGILIIGAGGVGKTTLAAILSGTFDWLTSDPWEYQESYGIKNEAIADDPKVGLVIPPGQPARRETMWRDVEQHLAQGQYRGVILVSAYGYHSIPQHSYKAHALYKGNKDEFLGAYLAACRADELAVLERVASSIRAAPNKMWLLSLALKEDLWYSDRDAVVAQYGTGRYADVVQQLATARGPTLLRHEHVRASLVINNFQSGEGEPLTKNVAGYDHRLQIESVRRMFEALGALREWEAT